MYALAGMSAVFHVFTCVANVTVPLQFINCIRVSWSQWCTRTDGADRVVCVLLLLLLMLWWCAAVAIAAGPSAAGVTLLWCGAPG